MDKNEWISNKIKKLMSEGKGQSQAIAQAYSMYEDMMQKGGLYFEDGGELPKYQIGVGIPNQFPYSSFQKYDNPKNQLSSTKGNEILAYPSTTYDKGVPQLGTPIIQSKSTFNPGQIPQWNMPQNNTPIPTSPIITQPTKKSVTTPQVKTEETLKPEVKSLKGTIGIDIKPSEQNLEDQIQKLAKEQADEAGLTDGTLNKTPNFNYQDPYQFFNPYGGVDISTAANYLGQSIENKDAFGIVTGGLKTGLGVARNIFGGMGQANVRNEAIKNFYNNQRDFMTGANTPQQMSSAEKGGTYPNFQDGGETYLATLLQNNPDIDLSQPALANLTIQGGKHFDKNLNREVDNFQTPKEYRFSISNEDMYGRGKGDYTFMDEKDYSILREIRDTDIDTDTTKTKYTADDRLKTAIKYYNQNLKRGLPNPQVYALSLEDIKGTKDTNGNWINLPASNEVQDEYDKIPQFRQKGGTIKTPFKKYLDKYPQTSEAQDTITPMGVTMDRIMPVKQQKDLNEAYYKTYSNYNKEYERFEDDAKPIRRLPKKQEGGEQVAQQASQDQLIQQVSQALQAGAQPEQVIQQLVSMGMSEEEAVQIIQMIMQQMQGQPAPEEQMMKCGGKKMQSGGEYLEMMKGKKIKNYTYNKETGNYDVEFE